MRAVVKSRPEPGLEWLEMPEPTPGPGEILVRVRAAAVCGTDLHIQEWDSWFKNLIQPPRIIGHEFSGEVVALGEGVDDIQPGDPVCAETHVPCGHCVQCLSGDQHLCHNTRLFGLHMDGAFAPLAVLPRVCAWKLPQGVEYEVGAIMEPMGVAIHALLEEDITGRSVAIFGVGPIGILAAAVARVAGAGPIFAVDLVRERRDLAVSMGATAAFDPVGTNVVESILQETSGIGVDVVIEVSGAPQAYEQGFQVLRKGGRISLVGIAGGPISIDVNAALVFKGARCYGISGRRMFETWTTMSALLERKAFDPAAVITHRFPMDQFEKGMQQAREGRAGKVLLIP